VPLPRRITAAAGLVPLLAVTGAGCHRAVPATPAASAPLALEEEYCWWTVFRTALPPDSVAEHFVRAFAQLGLSGGTWTARADTAWAHAEPTQRAHWPGGTFAARVVAYRVGDSTHFRHFVSVAPPAAGWPASRDSVTDDGRHVSISPSGSPIGFCGALGRDAQVHGTAPSEPDGEEKLDVWTRTAPED
jgi:hypothetical protein